MEETTANLLADIPVGLVAGAVATKVTGFAQEALYRPMPESIKEQEERVRPGPPSQVAAREGAEALGLDLNEEDLKPAAMAVHYGLGMMSGPVYTLLRRHSQMEPLGAAYVAGVTMSLVVDEALTPALGFSAEPGVSHRDAPAGLRRASGVRRSRSARGRSSLLVDRRGTSAQQSAPVTGGTCCRTPDLLTKSGPPWRQMMGGARPS